MGVSMGSQGQQPDCGVQDWLEATIASSVPEQTALQPAASVGAASAAAASTTDSITPPRQKITRQQQQHEIREAATDEDDEILITPHSRTAALPTPVTPVCCRNTSISTRRQFPAPCSEAPLA